MSELSKEEMDKIIKELEKRGAVKPCPRCGNNDFMIIDGYFSQTLQTDLSKGLAIGGPSIPSAIIVCTKCGYMSQHALGILGLLPNEGGTKGE